MDTGKSRLLDIDTSSRRIVDLTDAVRSFCGEHADGLCNVFVPHATAGVAIIETGAGSDDDLVDTLERLLPGMTATATRTGRRGTARTMCCPRSWRPRSRCRSRMANRCWVRGKVSCWSI